MNSWTEILKAEAEQSYFRQITAAVQRDAKNNEVYPPHNKIFEAFKLTPLNKVKAIILGQDPYHGPGQAHGLSFSVQKGIAIPPSLQNIYKELKADLNIDPPNHGCLEDWAKQGVLLLNSMLTVRKHEPGSHKSFGWETFTNNIISHLNQIKRPLVFILWGAYAKSKRDLILNEWHCALESSHPSPFSAHTGFFGSKPFSKTNDFLIQSGQEPIDWKIED